MDCAWREALRRNLRNYLPSIVCYVSLLIFLLSESLRANEITISSHTILAVKSVPTNFSLLPRPFKYSSLYIAWEQPSASLLIAVVFINIWFSFRFLLKKDVFTVGETSSLAFCIADVTCLSIVAAARDSTSTAVRE